MYILVIDPKGVIISIRNTDDRIIAHRNDNIMYDVHIKHPINREFVDVLITKLNLTKTTYYKD